MLELKVIRYVPSDSRRKIFGSDSTLSVNFGGALMLSVCNDLSSIAFREDSVCHARVMPIMPTNAYRRPLIFHPTETRMVKAAEYADHGHRPHNAGRANPAASPAINASTIATANRPALFFRQNMLFPITPVKRPPSGGGGDVFVVHGVVSVQIGHGSGDFQYSVICARGEIEF